MTELQQPVWLNPDQVPSLPIGWKAMPTEDACIQLKPGKLFDSKTVSQAGSVPVLNQSENGFLGYHDEKPGVVASMSAPVVTFANHTCAVRLMKQPFSTIQNIFPKIGKPGVTDTVYFYYAALGRVGLSDYKGHHPLFRKAHIPIPPLPIQRRIAGILSAYDELIENCQRRIKILEMIARALYHEWFVEFRSPGHENHPRVASLLGEIPNGWEVKVLGTLTTKIGSGATPRGGKGSYSSEGTALIRSLNIYDYLFELADLAFINEQQASDLDNVAVQENDILLNITGASVARCALAPSYLLPARVNQHVAIIRTDPAKADPFYILDAINSDARKAQLLALAQGGATREALTKHTVSNLEIVVPPRSTMERYGNIAQGIHKQREVLMRHIQNLRRTRDLLLPRLMSGQIALEPA